ncbi:hypothetical protein ACSXDM_15050 (plasmid) [Clostridium perfringens]|uniref:hypothetical protein n=1 Tax=Clostridium perfringens TaxID=1502 RepID=UPI0013E2AB82|nr:hypothetical protein [Clostridium perfringens]NGS95815.1 hypothetical protein [Clostridium perfringens]
MGEIKQLINENININSSVKIKENDIETIVMYLNCTLNTDALGVNINISVNDKELYKKYSVQIKEEYNKFKTVVENRATTLGYEIF